VRKGSVAAAVTALLTLVSGAAASSGAPPAGIAAHAADPLLGTWDTGRISFDRVRASLDHAGYTEPEIRYFLRDLGIRSAASWRLDLTFYRQRGVAALIRTGWSPEQTATPVDGEHGRYRLLSRHRLAITSADPKFNRWRELYSYKITGKTLRLRVIGETDPTLDKADLRLDMRKMYVMAAAALKKIA
jgi:hypothetical protein